jgi:intein/homing endonuclease
MINTESGHHRSIRTISEIEEILSSKMSELSPSEYELLEKLLEEMERQDPDYGNEVSLLEYDTPPVGVEEFLRSDYFMGDVGKNLYPLLMDDMVELFRGKYSEAILTGSIGFGKCVVPDTLLYDVSSGTRRKVCECDSLRVMSKTDGGKIVSKSAKAFRSGVKRCVRLTVVSGQSVTLSVDHLVFTDRGWVEAGSILDADLISVPRFAPDPDKHVEVSDDEVKLVAYLLSDGGCTGTVPTFTNQDDVLIEEFREIVRRVGEFDLRHLSKNERVPADWYGLPRRQIALFLNRFIACDGHVSTGSSRMVEIPLASEALADDLQFMMLRLGVHARKCFDPKKFDAWTLTVTSADELLRLFEAVGSIMSKEEESKSLVLECSGIKADINTDIVPIGIKELRKIRRELGDSGSDFVGKWGCPSGQHLSRARFEKLCRSEGYGGEYAWLAQSDLMWERVKSVEDAGEHEVWDLSVDGTHNFVGNGIVLHNSFFASLAIIYSLYLISCMKHPQSTYGIDEGSYISFCLLSVNEKTARRVVFSEIVTKLERSPYFIEKFPFKRLYSEIRFLKKNVLIVAGSTASNAILGLNVFGGVVDEANFMGSVKRLHQTGGNVAYGSMDRAEVIYETIMRRMKSRFMKVGKLPGILFLPSSKDVVSSFTERRIKEARDDPTVFVRDYATWDVKKRGSFGKARFKVLVGNERVRSKILEPGEDDNYKDLPDVNIVEVPEEYRRDFERNLEDAIRDIAGLSTLGISPFISQRDKIDEMVELGTYEGLEHPFSVLEWQTDQGGFFVWDRLVTRYQRKLTGGFYEDAWEPLRNPGAVRHVRLDTSLTCDSTGFAMGHVSGWVEVTRRDDDSDEFSELAPIIVIDFVLRMIPPLGGEIMLGNSRSLMYQLMERGFNIGYMSTDAYQSADTKQKMQQRGVRAEIVSLDRTTEAYEVFKTALYEGRVRCYRYPMLIRELENLEVDRVRKKVDHPAKNPDGSIGSKDVADAVAGLVFSLTMKGSMMPIPPSRNDPKSNADGDDSWVVDGWTSVKNEGGDNGGGGGGGGGLPPMPFLG